eukprot:gene39164-48374_t
MTTAIFAGQNIAQGGFSGDGGRATSALLNNPQGIIKNDMRYYISDTGNSVIRRISQSGDIETWIGVGTVNGYNVFAASGLSGYIYVGDAGTAKIFGIDPADGTMFLVAGRGTPGYSGDGGEAKN